MVQALRAGDGDVLVPCRAEPATVGQELVEPGPWDHGFPAQPRGWEQLSASRKNNIRTLRKSEVRASLPILLRPPGPILFLSASSGRAALCRVSL